MHHTELRIYFQSWGRIEPSLIPTDRSHNEYDKLQVTTDETEYLHIIIWN